MLAHKPYKKHCESRWQYKKPRNKNGLITVSTRVSTIRLVYIRDPPTERKVKVKDRDIRVQRPRPVMQIVKVPRFLVGLQTTALGTSGLKKPCAVMGVMV